LASDRLLEVLRYGVERLKLLQRWREIAAQVAGKVREKFPDAEVYVFGSVVEGRYTAASDIDILVVTKRAPRGRAERIELLLWLEDELGLPPGILDLHVVRPGSEEYEWFFKVLKIRAVKVEPRLE
jgi:predicted nucleotidyltransferase